jgi:hypothetical protein
VGPWLSLFGSYPTAAAMSISLCRKRLRPCPVPTLNDKSKHNHAAMSSALQRSMTTPHSGLPTMG